MALPCYLGNAWTGTWLSWHNMRLNIISVNWKVNNCIAASIFSWVEPNQNGLCQWKKLIQRKRNRGTRITTGRREQPDKTHFPVFRDHCWNCGNTRQWNRHHDLSEAIHWNKNVDIEQTDPQSNDNWSDLVHVIDPGLWLESRQRRIKQELELFVHVAWSKLKHGSGHLLSVRSWIWSS